MSDSKTKNDYSWMFVAIVRVRTDTHTHEFVGSRQCSWPRPQPKRGAIVSVPIMEAGPVGAH